ncbi:hypothetical protein HDA31_006232 [Micromonospora carbonacea subsp. aurantiaca]|nr:hypothetical protein [Micromonospora carbonacea]
MPVLLRKAQAPRSERASHRGLQGASDVGLTRSARRGARPDRRPHPRPDRRAGQRQRHDLRRQGVPGALAAVSVRRSNAADTDPDCPTGRRPSTATTPRSGPSANAPSPPSKPGRFWPSSAAAPDASPRSCRPSSSYITSRPAGTHDEKGSLIAAMCMVAS